jgi:hypothetical protein
MISIPGRARAAVVLLPFAIAACSDPSGPKPDPDPSVCGAAPPAIPVGEVLTGTAGDPAWCVDLPASAGFVIAVTNVNSDSTALRNVRVRTLQPAGVAASPAAEPVARVGASTPRAVLPPRARHGALHGSVLDENSRRLAEPRRLPEMAASLAATAVPVVGDTLTFRVPRISEGVAQACDKFDAVRARVAYVGARSVVVEDVENPVVNQLDDYYRQLGEEFDTRQYALIRDNFADPLLLDASLDGNGRLFMLFTRQVDASRISGFVWSGDFYPTSQCAQSNLGEIFYGYVPSDPDPAYGAGTAGEWFWSIRSTVVHEVKHIASFAQRISLAAGRGEESWLEESTAMVAEELWARQVFGYAANANVSYAASVGCEIRGAFNVAPCAGKPSVMFSHFMTLSQWMKEPDQRTPLRSVAEGDGSFYGSGWLFLRWALDHSGRPEGQVLRELTQTTTRGVANLEARVGRAFPDLITDWALAVALDDRPATTPVNARWRIPSWNIRGVYAGLNQEQSQLMPTEFPLLQRSLANTASSTTVTGIRPGGTAYFQLNTGSPQAVDFQTVNGGSAAGVRVSIYRLY